jgi:hypothetical protein
MNNDQDLDCLIDEAARRMAQREPSPALSEAVMERISAPARHFSGARLVWGSVAAAMVISAAVMFVQVNRPAPAAEARQQAQGSGLTAQGSGTEGSGPKAQGSGTEAPLMTDAVAASRPASIVVEETELMNDSIAFDLIAPAPLEVDRIEVALVEAIHPIEIAPLEIEPLSASND